METRSFARLRYSTLLAALLATAGGCESGTGPTVEPPPPPDTFPTICDPIGALFVPDTAQGRLTSGECVLRQRYVDVWTLDVDANVELTLDLISEEFDPTLELLDGEGRMIVQDDDGGVGFNSRINREYGEGRYYLYVSSFFEYSAGGYQLSVYEGPPVSPCPPTATLDFPDTVAAAVTASSCDFEGYYVDVWRLDLTVDTIVSLYVETAELEPVLLIADPTGQFLQWGTQMDGRAWLEASLPAGAYDVWIADAYHRGRTGSYTLAVRGGPEALQCPAAGSVGLGETADGEITGEECVLGYRRGEAWELELAEPTEIAVLARGDGMYPYVQIFNGSGHVVGEAWGTESVAGADIELDRGTYRIWVLAALDFEGRYTLMVGDGPTWSSCPAAGTIAVGESVNGKITNEDCILDYGQGEPWELQLADSADLAMSVEGEVMYPYLRVIDAQGRDVAHGFGDESSAGLDVALGPGAYRIWVLGPQEPDLQGTYMLTAWDAGSTPTCDPEGAAAPGDTVVGALSSTDCAFPDGRYGDLWTMRLDSSATVAIRLTSDKIDPYLVVADSAGAVIAEDDDGGAGLNAALTIEISAGSYQVWATSFAAGEIGAYELSFQLTNASASADRDAAVATGKGTGPDTREALTVRRPARPLPPARVQLPALLATVGKVGAAAGGR